jgi:hypothetical protein
MIAIDDDRLQHSMHSYRLGEFVDLVAIEHIAWLLLTRVDLVERYIMELFEVLGQHRFGQRWGGAG